MDGSLNWVLHYLVGCAAMELGIKRDISLTKAPLRGIQFNLERIADNIDKRATLNARDNLTMLGGFILFCLAFAVERRLGADDDNRHILTARYSFL